jgi:hypothetical protein
MLCLTIAGGICIVIMIAARFSEGFAHRALGNGSQSVWVPCRRMIPLSFVVEEVPFRGAFGAHVHHSGESRGFLSALFVSPLWGLWHWPVGLGQAPC